MRDWFSDDDVIAVSPDGNERVIAKHDPYPDPPDWDGMMPTLQINLGGGSYGGCSVELIHGHDGLGYRYGDLGNGRYGYSPDPYNYPDFENTLRVWIDDLGTDGIYKFTRYLRIFHGTRTSYTYNVGNSREYGYVVFDTKAWRMKQGLTDEHLAQHPDVILEAERDFAPHQAYCEGDVYYLQVQKKVRLHITKEDLAYPNRPWEDTIEEEWEDEDSLHGLYGTDMEEARDMASQMVEWDTTKNQD